MSMQTVLVGCDFSSSPTLRKPIVMAWGQLRGAVVVLDRLEHLPTLGAFEDWLAQPRAWTAGFDMPFGLPRELVVTLAWPQDWEACMGHYASLSRAEVRAQFKAFCDARPVGNKFAHRACDLPAGSSPSMKWVNPPVAYMLHAGVPRLLSAGVHCVGLQARPSASSKTPVEHHKIALEAYPGLLAREVLGNRSYKSDNAAKQTPERLIARKDLLHALETGQTRLGLRLKLSHAQRDALVDDAKGDTLDAVLCLMQVAWAERQLAAGDRRYGLPPEMDPLEGWILTV